MKESIRVLLACNTDGNGNFPPLVIGKSEHPLCFEKVRKLSREYVNKKTWVIWAMYINCLSKEVPKTRFYFSLTSVLLIPKIQVTSRMGMLCFFLRLHQSSPTT
jgi:hypothetical protein